MKHTAHRNKEQERRIPFIQNSRVLDICNIAMRMKRHCNTDKINEKYLQVQEPGQLSGIALGYGLDDRELES
jgi:hypothetical protein